jgi:hypothetical protein
MKRSCKSFIILVSDTLRENNKTKLVDFVPSNVVYFSLILKAIENIAVLSELAFRFRAVHENGSPNFCKAL